MMLAPIDCTMILGTPASTISKFMGPVLFPNQDTFPRIIYWLVDSLIIIS